MSSSSVTPGVVLKTRFVTSNKKAYQDYVDYVDRDNAKKEQGAHEKLFTLYQDYLSNPDKTSALFTQQSDRLDEEEKKNSSRLLEGKWF
jgi:MobL relaxases